MQPANTDRLSYIDCLRAIAACAVMYQHVVERSSLTLLHPTLDLSPGLFGVVLFFFLSGYVIPLSVRGPINSWRFAVRRIFRIFPAYYFLLLLVYLFPFVGLHIPALQAETLDAPGWLANLLLIQDFTGQPAVLGVSWTLIIEIAWYVLFLVAYLSFGHRRVAALCLGFTALLCTLGIVSLCAGVRLPLGRVGLVNAAMLGYAAFAFRRGLIGGRRFATLVSAFAITTGFTQWVSFGHFSHPNMTLMHVFFGWSLPTLLFLPFVVSKRVAESRFANLRPLVKLGEISYSVYLVHGIVLEIHRFFVGQAFVWLSVPSFTILASLLMFRYVEQNGIKWGRMLTAPAARVDAIRPSLELSD